MPARPPATPRPTSKEGTPARAAASASPGPPPRRPATADQRRAAVKGWKRLARAGKLHCGVNCPLEALGECSMCGR